MKKVFRIEGIDCANCAAKIEREINELDVVENAIVNFMTLKLTLEAEKENMNVAIEKAMDIVKKIEPDAVVSKF